MGILLMLIGYGWAAIGAGNLLMAEWGAMSEGVMVFTLIFNGLLFVLPGLIVGGLGGLMRRKGKAAEET